MPDLILGPSNRRDVEFNVASDNALISADFIDYNTDEAVALLLLDPSSDIRTNVNLRLWFNWENGGNQTQSRSFTNYNPNNESVVAFCSSRTATSQQMQDDVTLVWYDSPYPSESADAPEYAIIRRYVNWMGGAASHTINVFKPADALNMEINGIEYDRGSNKYLIYGTIRYTQDAQGNPTNVNFVKIISATETLVNLVRAGSINVPDSAREGGLAYGDNRLFVHGGNQGVNLYQYSVNVANDNLTFTNSQANFTLYHNMNRRNVPIAYNANDSTKPLVAFSRWNASNESATDKIFATHWITPPNVPPVFDAVTRLVTSTTIRANPPIGFVVRDVDATDPDNVANIITYSLEGADASKFAISRAGTITVAEALTNNTTYNITLAATDNENGKTTLAITVIVLEFNSPVLPNLRQTWQVDEETEIGTVIGEVEATHTDDVAITYTLEGTDASDFAIGSTTGIVTAGLASYLVDTDYDFTIKATDANGQTDTVAVRVTRYKAAIIPGTRIYRAFGRDYKVRLLALANRYAFYENEDAIAGQTPIRTGFAPTLLPGDTITISGKDAEFFRVDIPFVNAPTVDNRRANIQTLVDLDPNRIYVFDVDFRNAAGERDSERCWVSVYDPNGNYPRATLANRTFRIPTNTPVGTIVGRLTVDYPNIPFIYDIATLIDYEAPHGNPDVTSAIGIGSGNQFTEVFDIDPLTGKIRTRIQITQPTGFTRVGNRSIHWFVIDARGFYSSLQTFTASLNSLNTLACFFVNTTLPVPNYDPARVNVVLPSSLTGLVANLSTPNATNYVVMGDAARFFNINSLTGFLSITSGLSLAQLPIHLIVIASNADGNSSVLYVSMTSTGAIDIVPIQPNRPPVFSNNFVNFVMEFNTAVNQVVGSISATDPDNDTLTYSLTGTGHENFAISNTGQITLAVALQNSISLTVTGVATDPDGASDTIEINVSVQDPNANNPPIFSLDSQTFTISANPVTNTVAGIVAAIDIDGDTLSYALSGQDASLFSITPQGGLIRVAGNLTNGTTYEFTVTASDRTESDSIAISVEVADAGVPVDPIQPVLPVVPIDADAYGGFVNITGLESDENVVYATADAENIYVITRNDTNTIQGLRVIDKTGLVLTNPNFNIPNNFDIVGLARIGGNGIAFISTDSGTGAIRVYDLSGAQLTLQELREIDFGILDIVDLPAYALEYVPTDRRYRIFAAGYNRLISGVDYGDQSDNVIVWEVTRTGFLSRPLGEWITLTRPIPLLSSTYGDRKYYFEFTAGRIDIYDEAFTFESVYDISASGSGLGTIIDIAFSNGQLLVIDDNHRIHYFGSQPTEVEALEGVKQIFILDDFQYYDVVRPSDDFQIIATNVPALSETAVDYAEIGTGSLRNALDRVQITPETTIPTARAGDRIFLHTGEPDANPVRLPASGVLEIVGIVSVGRTRQAFICETD